MSMRSALTGKRLASVSSDGGSTWSAPWSTVAETKCEASTISLPGHPSGPTLAMSSAYASGRTNMTIHTSIDNGHTWIAAVQVYPGSSAYSALLPLQGGSGGSVGLLFERDGYSKITYTPLSLL
jgi:Neuraminidase (sialidase)